MTPTTQIKHHRDGIEASVTHGLSNGLTESSNTKRNPFSGRGTRCGRLRASNGPLRLIIRIAYGFRSTDNLMALCLLDRGGRCPPLPGRPAAE